MKNLLLVAVVALALAGCWKDKKQEISSQRECFSIITLHEQPPILIDKCTGDTWVLSASPRSPDSSDHTLPTLTYVWNKIKRHDHLEELNKSRDSELDRLKQKYGLE